VAKKKKTLLRLLLEFVAITVPLTAFWLNGGSEAYFQLFRFFARPILVEMGATSLLRGAVSDRMVSVIPFLGLMVVTPQLSLRRRLGGIGLGLLVIFLSHVGLSYWAFVSFIPDGKTAESLARYFPAQIACDATPFVLWAIFANEYLSELFRKVMPPGTMPPPRRRAPSPEAVGDTAAGPDADAPGS
jgi:hypothetical protein